MQKKKPFVIKEMGTLDALSQGGFVQPPCTDSRQQDDEIMRKFIEQQKQKNMAEA